ncbi:MAG: hypothetical protein R3F42_00085 [Pseudomonadota bacterium]
MNTVSAEQLPHSDLQYYPDLARKRAAVQAVLARTGTPVFLCDSDIVADRYRAMDASLTGNWPAHVIGFSFKTNYQLAGTGILQRAGAWAEVVSGREYRLARALGYPGHSIIFNGPYKTDADLRTAFAEGALVNLNDHDELDRVVAMGTAFAAPVAVGLRVASTLPRLGHSRFGFSLENGEALAAVEKLRRAPGLQLVALHTNLYGDTDDPGIYSVAAGRLGEFAQRHLDAGGTALRYIDLGGGYPAHTPKPKSREQWEPQEIGAYVQAITAALGQHFPAAQPRPALILEPGRYLSADGIVLVTRVVHVKRRNDRQEINCNGSISMVPLTHYSPQVIRAWTEDLQQRRGPAAPTVIFGATCRENDILYDGPFVEVRPGDFLVHYAVGAYNANLGPDFIYEAPGLELI